MLPASQRMRRSRDFEVTIRRGQRAGTRCLVVHHLAGVTANAEGNPRLGPVPGSKLRVGFVVSRAVGMAVVRNRVRRRLRETVRARRDVLDPGLWVVRANPAAAEASYQGLGEEFDRCLRRLSGATS